MYSAISTAQHLFLEVDVQFCTYKRIKNCFGCLLYRKCNQFSKNSKVFRIFHYIQNLTFETPKILTIFEPH